MLLYKGANQMHRCGENLSNLLHLNVTHSYWGLAMCELLFQEAEAWTGCPKHVINKDTEWVLLGSIHIVMSIQFALQPRICIDLWLRTRLGRDWRIIIKSAQWNLHLTSLSQHLSAYLTKRENRPAEPSQSTISEITAYCYFKALSLELLLWNNR